MADIQKPTRKKKKSTPPMPDDGNKQELRKPSNDERAQLKFDVPAEFKKDYKSYALENDMTMVELLGLSFEAYKLSRKL